MTTSKKFFRFSMKLSAILLAVAWLVAAYQIGVKL